MLVLILLAMIMCWCIIYLLIHYLMPTQTDVSAVFAYVSAVKEESEINTIKVQNKYLCVCVCACVRACVYVCIKE